MTNAAATATIILVAILAFIIGYFVGAQRASDDDLLLTSPLPSVNLFSPVSSPSPIIVQTPSPSGSPLLITTPSPTTSALTSPRLSPTPVTSPTATPLPAL